MAIWCLVLFLVPRWSQDVISFDEALTSSCRSQRWKSVVPPFGRNFRQFWRICHLSFVQFVSMFSRCLRVFYQLLRQKSGDVLRLPWWKAMWCYTTASCRGWDSTLPDDSFVWISHAVTRLLCHVVSSHPEFDEFSWIARMQPEANGSECSSGCISEVCGDVCDARNFHVGLLCFIASAFSRQQMLWMAVLPDQISYGNVWVPSERRKTPWSFLQKHFLRHVPFVLIIREVM